VSNLTPIIALSKLQALDVSQKGARSQAGCKPVKSANAQLLRYAGKRSGAGRGLITVADALVLLHAGEQPCADTEPAKAANAQLLR
jgi:hypothetical protein